MRKSWSNRLHRNAAIILALASLSACSMLPQAPMQRVTEKTTTSERLSRTATYPCGIRDSLGACFFKKDAFIGVAVSGGGSRSANFALRVLQDLELLGLDSSTISAISSTSGGSLTAAYYALERYRAEDFWPSAYLRLRQDFAAEIIGHAVEPPTWLRFLTTTYNRTDVLADVLDDKLLNKATFASLGPVLEATPSLYINATMAAASPTASSEVYTEGANVYRWGYGTFTFSEEAADDLGWDLQKVRLADAVAASAAFPGVFPAVAYPVYSHGKSFPFLHLIDGGATDNLAAKKLVREAVRHKRLFPPDYAQRYGGCLLVLVDAHVEPHTDWRPEKPQIGGLVPGSLLDTSLEDAFDGLLINQRDEQLLRLGLNLSKRTSSSNYMRFVPNATIDLRRFAYNEAGSGTRYDTTDRAPPPNVTAMTCAVWHIALSEIFSLPQGIEQPLGVALPDGVWTDALQKIVDEVDTDLRLVFKQPSNCRPRQIQDLLSLAADTLVLSDAVSRKAACAWFESAGIVERRPNGNRPGCGDFDYANDHPAPISTSARLQVSKNGRSSFSISCGEE